MRKYFILILFLLGVCFSYGQKNTYETKRINGAPPQIDGLLDDSCWGHVNATTGLTQFLPNNGAVATKQGEFKLLYDDKYLYVAIVNHDDLQKIDSRMTRRDVFEGDLCGIHLDTYNDKRTGFVFLVSAGGVKTDLIITNDGGEFNLNWDPIWWVKTSINSNGWTAEMKIPISQLRFTASDDEYDWNVQFVRTLFRNNEIDVWNPVSNTEGGWVRHYGKLKGIKNINTERNIEIAPYLATGIKSFEKENNNPYADGLDLIWNAGVDIKLGITNDLTLDIAINPDFGQVEADPSEVNLSTEESFFEEKRPFFVEGNNITNFQITPNAGPWSVDNLFYSRRIGSYPSLDPDILDNEFLKPLKKVQIIGALKLTGRTKKGWSIGLINNVCNKEKAKITLNGQEREETVEPLTNYFIGRLQKESSSGNTIIGGIFTATNRVINKPVLQYLAANAYTYGLDGIHYFNNKKYFIRSNIIGSYISGNTKAIFDLQTSNLRLFQRPDANYLHLDSTAHKLTGNGGTISAGTISEVGWRFMGSYTWRSPGLELNDIGFLRQANASMQVIWLGYKTKKPFSIFREMSFDFNQWAGWDAGSNNTFIGGNISTEFIFLNQYIIGASVRGGFFDIDNAALRGGPALTLPGNINISLRAESNPSKKLSVKLRYNYNGGKNNYTHSISYSANITYRPSDKLSFSIMPFYSNSYNELQYVSTEPFNGKDTYILAAINRETYNGIFRVDLNINPNMTLQYYGSPFLSTGLYNKFKFIDNPSASNYSNRFIHYNAEQLKQIVLEEEKKYLIDHDFDGQVDYNIENPDFNFSQFNSNLVFRWEYTPGSVVYAVWSQNRTKYDTDASVKNLNLINDLFEKYPTNIFLVKFSHRFSL